MKLVLIFIASLSLTTPLFSQKWKPCKIVLNNSDTLKGEGYIADDTISFRIDKVKKRYTADNVSYAEIDEDRYVSSAIMRPEQKDKNFLKVLVDGDLHLYIKEKNSLNANQAFYFSKMSGPLVELTKTVREVKKDGQTYLLHFDAYRNQLKDMLKDCPTISLEEKREYFTENKMKQVIEDYSKCKDYKIGYLQKSKRTKGIVSLMAGYEVSNFNFAISNNPTTYATFYYLDNMKVNSSQPFFGLQVKFPASQAQNLNFVAELMYKRTDLSFTSQPRHVTNEVSEVKMVVNYLKINLGVEKNIPLNKNLSLALTGGVGMYNRLSSSFAQRNTSSGQVNTDFSYKNFELSVLAGVGLNLKGTSFFVRDEILSGFTFYGSVSTSMNYLYFGVSQRISK